MKKKCLCSYHLNMQRSRTESNLSVDSQSHPVHSRTPSVDSQELTPRLTIRRVRDMTIVRRDRTPTPTQSKYFFREKETATKKSNKR